MKAKFFSRADVYAYNADPVRLPVLLSVILMLLSSGLRLWYYVVKPLSGTGLLLHLVLPLVAATAFICAVAFAGARSAFPSVLGVLLGVVFFMLKAADFAPWHQALCTVLYLAVAALYTLTVLGVLPTKRLLYPLFGLPLIYHIVVEDTQYYFFADPPVPVFDWLPEISVLCIMGALLCISIGMRKNDDEMIVDQ